ncbi:MAG TPA: hypothetical protein VJ739_02260 [Gemmataceae bacterium]|nr:hypothetical protein [Gemmataceae bacterium]
MTSEERPSGREKVWAVVRLALGVAQVMGATISLTLLLQTETSAVAIGTVAVSGLLVVVSKLLFREG